MISCIHTWTNEVMTVHTGCLQSQFPLRNLTFVAVTASPLSALPDLNYLWHYKTISSLQPLVCVLGVCVGVFLWLFCSRSSMNVLDFSAPKWWMFFASVWLPKPSNLWLLTKSLLRALFNCSHLCCHFAFASWHALHVCSACCSYLLDHPSYSLWWFHTSLPEGTNFWCFHGIFVGYVGDTKMGETANLFSFRKATDTIITSVWKTLNLQHRHTLLCRQHSRIVPLDLGEKKVKRQNLVHCSFEVCLVMENQKLFLFLEQWWLCFWSHFFSFCIIIPVVLKLARGFCLVQQRV